MLVADAIAQPGVDLLLSEAEVDNCPGLPRDALLERVATCDALVVRSQTKVSRELLQAGNNLKVVGRAGVGVDNIDVEEATSRGIVVVNVPGGNTMAACEHTLALLFAIARNIPQADAALRKSQWEREAFMGTELNGKVLGVIGTGKVGLEVARRARSLGMEVIAYDPYISPEQISKMDISQVSLEETLSRADFVTLHCPLTRETRGMIGRDEIALMKPSARLINCARGSVVDEKALCQALKEGRIAGAALDVFSKEPLGPSPLVDLPNVVLTPHLGASTVEAQDYNAIYVAEQVLKALKGLPVESAVNQPRLSREDWSALRPLIPLAELLGLLHAQVFPWALEQAQVSFANVECDNTSLATSYILKGLLQNTVAAPCNHINAPLVARERGTKVSETRHLDHGHPWMIQLRAGTAHRLRTVSGILTPAGQARVVEMDGYSLEFVPSPHMLVCPHADRPGLIGRVGTLLGERRVNIASMQVGRKSVGGDALMILQVDEPVPGDLSNSIAGVPGVHGVRAVELPAQLLKEAGADPIVP
ncbi:MAG: phosphoglycerate dehydrogenase [Bacillota bacterium]